jgi:hypothetical protein
MSLRALAPRKCGPWQPWTWTALSKFFFSRTPKQGICRGRQCSHYAWTTRRPGYRVADTPSSGESKAAFCLLPLVFSRTTSIAAPRVNRNRRQTWNPATDHTIWGWLVLLGSTTRTSGFSCVVSFQHSVWILKGWSWTRSMHATMHLTLSWCRLFICWDRASY